MKKLKLISILMIVMSAIVILNGCEKSVDGFNPAKNGEIIFPESINLLDRNNDIKLEKGDTITLYSNDAIDEKYKSYQIVAEVIPNNASNLGVSYIVENGDEFISVSKTGLITLKGSNIKGVAYVTVFSNALNSIKKTLVVNISDSNVLPTNGQNNSYSSISWEDLPNTSITSDTKVFDENDYINKKENLKEISSDLTVDNGANALSLIARYQIINVSIKGPNGNPVVIDNVVGSGDNMRGEFAVNAVLAPEGISSSMGLAIKMQLKLQFHRNLVNQGVPETIRFINTAFYSPIESTDIPKEFGKLAPVIDDANQTVTFNLNSSQLSSYIPNGYIMSIVLKKVEDDALDLVNFNHIQLDNSKYFIENPDDVSSVTITNKFASIVANEQKEITYVIKPETALNKNVTWKVEPESVATIIEEKGKVYLVGKTVGQSAKITVTTVDGLFTDTFNVNVEKKHIKVEKIAANISGNVKLDINKYLSPLKENSDILFTYTPSSPSDTTLKIDSVSSNNVLAEIVNKNTLRVTGKSVTGNTPTEIVVSSIDNPDAKATVKVEVADTTKRINQITFAENIVNKKIGDGKFTNPVTISPNDADNKEVTYNSTNINVATVDSKTGEVTIKNTTGTTTITATAKDGAVTGSYTLNVSQKGVSVTGISMAPSMTVRDTETNASVQVTGYLPPEANIDSEKTVTFTQDTTDYITVDSVTGRITVKKRDDNNYGVTRVTATTPNGVSAYCDVIITSSYIALDSVTITNKQDAAIDIKKGEYFDITTSITPAAPTNSNLVYSVEGGSSDILSINDNRVTAIGSGQATVKVCGQIENTVCDTISFNAWEVNDLTGEYTVNSFLVNWRNASGNETNYSMDSSKVASDKRYYEQTQFALSTKNGELKVSGKLQVVYGHIINNPHWDEFRFKYFNHTDNNLTERDMSNDRYANKRITVNPDGTIIYVFPFTISGDRLVYSANSQDTITFMLTKKNDTYKEVNSAKFREVTPFAWYDPYSFNGTYNMSGFVTDNSKNSMGGGNVGTRRADNIDYGGIEHYQGEFTINVQTNVASSTNRAVNMRTKIQLQSSGLEKVGSMAGQCVECGQFSYIDFESTTLSPNASSFGATGAENKAQVSIENNELKVVQRFVRTVKIVININTDVWVYSWFNKSSDTWKDLSTESTKCYFATYGGSPANATNIASGSCTP